MAMQIHPRINDTKIQPPYVNQPNKADSFICFKIGDVEIYYDDEADIDALIAAACEAKKIWREHRERHGLAVHGQDPYRAQCNLPEEHHPNLTGATIDCATPEHHADAAVGCSARGPDGMYVCTRDAGHPGSHEAHGAVPLPVWNDGDTDYAKDAGHECAGEECFDRAEGSRP